MLNVKNAALHHPNHHHHTSTHYQSSSSFSSSADNSQLQALSKTSDEQEEVLTRMRDLTLPSRKRTSQRSSQTALGFGARSSSTSSSSTRGWRGGLTSRNCRCTAVALLGVGNFLESRATADVVQQAVATGHGDLWNGCSGVGSHTDVSARRTRGHRGWGRRTAR
jgi:hypothetical protein